MVDIAAALHDINVIRAELGKRPLGSMPRAYKRDLIGGSACTCPIARALGLGSTAGLCHWYATDAKGIQQSGATTPAMSRFMRAYDDGKLPQYQP